MHPILFGNQTIITKEKDYQISTKDAPFFAVRGGGADSNTIYLPNSKSTEDGYTVAIHNQTSGGFYINTVEGSGDRVANQKPPFLVQQPGQLYIFRLDKPAQLWRPLLGYYPGNCN